MLGQLEVHKQKNKVEPFPCATHEFRSQSYQNSCWEGERRRLLVALLKGSGKILTWCVKTWFQILLSGIQVRNGNKV